MYKVKEFLNYAGKAYSSESLHEKTHVTELEQEVKSLRSELSKYKEKTPEMKRLSKREELEKRVMEKISDVEDIPIKTKIKLVNIDREEVKKIQLQILKLEKICAILSRTNKTKKLKEVKEKLKKLEKKLKTIKDL